MQCTSTLEASMLMDMLSDEYPGEPGCTMAPSGVVRTTLIMSQPDTCRLLLADLDLFLLFVTDLSSVLCN